MIPRCFVCESTGICPHREVELLAWYAASCGTVREFVETIRNRAESRQDAPVSGEDETIRRKPVVNSRASSAPGYSALRGW